MEPAVSCIVGDFGSGKSLFLTSLAFANNGKRKIFANFKLYDIEYTPMALEDIAKFPEELEDAIILLDEGHVGAHAYDFFKKDVRNVSTFITQIRKRNVVVFWSSQLFNKVAKGLRDYTHYSFEMYKTETAGISIIKVFDIFENRFIKEIMLDLRDFFDKYDTKQIILK